MCVKQYRHSVERELLEFPAGTLEAGEIIEDAAARELEEEIGFFPARSYFAGQHISRTWFFQ